MSDRCSSLNTDGPWLGLLLYVSVSPSSELRGWANQYGCVGLHLRISSINYCLVV